MPSSGFDRKKGTLQRNLSIDYSKIQIAKVKSSSDATHNGKLIVWLVNSNTNESLEENWISVMYASPFAGSTNIDDVSRQAYQSFDGTQKSYGFFAVPPDNNNYVLVVFANGDETQGYWFACIYKDTLTHMVPGLGQDKSYGGQSGPVAEMNVYSGQSGNPQVNPLRPTYTPLFNGLVLQGLNNDSLRGAGNSSVWRDSSPTVQGWLTPGGNHIVLDDKTGNQLIRIRTKSGAQILISETDGHIYAISRDGKSWMELNVDGNIDMYSGISVNVHSDSNINMSANGHVNIAGATVNIQSTNGDLSLRAGDTLNLYGGNDINSITPNGSGAQAVPPPIPMPTRIPGHEPFNRQGN
jgi:hypothetical protein